MVTSLEEATHPSAVMELAGTASFVSGTSYFHRGHLEVTSQQPDEAAAVVRGTLPYDVRLWLERGRLRWSCSCPAAEDGSFCKHCVAVALHLQPEGTDPFAVAMGMDRGDDPDDALLAEHVDTLDHDDLAALVLEAADNDWRLRERLLLEARSEAGEDPDAQVWRDRLDIAFAPDGDWVTWHETGEWTADIEQVLDGIDDLLHDGHAAIVIELAEHAYRLAAASREYVHHDSPAPADLAMRSRDLHWRPARQHSRTRSTSRGDWSRWNWTSGSTNSAGQLPTTPRSWVPRVWPSTAGRWMLGLPAVPLAVTGGC